jgi:hypothetical protein
MYKSAPDCVPPNLPKVRLLVVRQNWLSDSARFPGFAQGLPKMLTTLWISSFYNLQTQTMFLFPCSS